MKTLNFRVFIPTLIILLVVIICSVVNKVHFLSATISVKVWVLKQFGPVFTWSTFFFLLIVCLVYFSKIGRLKIGGDNAVPELSKWKWFAVTLCTTIATGILFWGPAEPLYHYHMPPEGVLLLPQSKPAAHFAISTVLMHWTLTPYGIYTMAALVFAIGYYNYKQPFNLGTLLYPVFGKYSQGTLGSVVSIISLIGLVAGMAASLGAGMLSIKGGIESLFRVKTSTGLLIIIGMLIIGTFIFSAASGLKKGIQKLSSFNAFAFFLLIVFVFVFGPTTHILIQSFEGLKDYVLNFFQRSTMIWSGIDKDWLNDWTIFYWSNWMAWTPVTALFLGRISKGYTVRQFIHFNLLLPALFGGIWMMVFSNTAIYFDQLAEGALFELLQTFGQEQVAFYIFEKLPFSKILSLFFLVAIFISYVTAADSNISAMSSITSYGISPEKPEAPLWIKITWGILIGAISLLMITLADVEGIKMISILGGFPALILLILVAIGLVKLVFKKNENN